MKLVFSEFFLDETRHRVQRGLVGEFDRGSMVTDLMAIASTAAVTSAVAVAGRLSPPRRWWLKKCSVAGRLGPRSARLPRY